LETNQGEADTAGKQGDTIKPLTFADVFFFNFLYFFFKIFRFLHIFVQIGLVIKV